MKILIKEPEHWCSAPPGQPLCYTSIQANPICPTVSTPPCQSHPLLFNLPATPPSALHSPPPLSISGPGFFHLGFFCYLCRKLNGMCIKIFATRQCGPCFNPNKRHQHLQFCVAYGVIAWELGLAKSSDLGTESSQQGEIGFKRCCNNQGIAVLLTIIEKWFLCTVSIRASVPFGKEK